MKKFTLPLLLKVWLMMFLISGAYVTQAQTSLIGAGATWKYLDNNTRPANWETSGFNDASWSSGSAVLGYGTITGSTVSTTVSYGSNSSAKYPTTYFRKTFNTTASFAGGLDLELLCDDGAIVYINGTEVLRYNMPSSGVGHTTYASSTISGSDEGDYTTYNVSASVLVSGTNTVAVEVHNRSGSSSDLGFDLSIEGIGSAPTYLLSPEDTDWKYLDNNTRPSNWETTSYNDGSWASGQSPMGYGTIDGASLNTTVSYGSSSTNKYPTTYFRNTFNATTTSYAGGLDFQLLCDDGAIVYLNGTEVIRYNMPTGSVSHTTNANSAVGGSDEGDYSSYNVSSSHLVSGTNVIAVEIHQANATSSDLGFDLSVEGLTTASFDLVNGPYLQMATPTSMTVRWRTQQSTDAKVFYGTSESSLSSSSTQSTTGIEHEVELTGLTPNTKYFYAVGTMNDDTIQRGSDNYFITPPTVGTEKATRIWVLGDCGSASTTQTQNKNQYYAYDGAYTDAVLLLGDNAYSNGTDEEFKNKFFNYYDDKILKQSPLWPAPGNHDYAQSSARQDDKNIPYYDLFTVPTAGEAGGVASGTEAFYSFDLANIHFLSLDSYGEESNKRMSDTTGDQAVWVKQDLAANDATWTIAYWHHPPYTMGSHNSDNEGELADIRSEFLAMMEQYDVDMILCGHSHNYERTKLIHGHYGNENSFSSATHDVSTSSGQYTGSGNSCPYTKDTGDHIGTVYVVSGSAGRATSTQGSWPHDAMYTAYNVAGTFVLDIEGGRLDAKFLGYDGLVRDSFTMFKNVNVTEELSVNSGDSIDLTASWLGEYSWNTTETTKSIRVDSDSATYVVTDGKGCLSDTIIVNTGAPTGPTCTDGIQNGSETGVDCGGPDCPACPTCTDGIQNGSETGVDCGGPDCPACPTCTDGIQNGSETGVDCGGPDCPACPTCTDGIQNGGETGVDCGGPDCPACPTCTDGIQNGSETGVDCGGPDCPACPTCTDGIQNGSETGVDCGGPDCPACPTCTDGIQNGSETGVDCGGPDCPACPTCTDGIQNGSETGVDCGGPDCPACPTCTDGVQNGSETGVDCGGPDCPACSSSCTETIIDYENFESGWGIWNDGGSDARRSSKDVTYAIGTYCARIRDNTSTSVITTDNLNLSSYDSIKVSFTYYPRSMDNSNEDFWLQLSTDGGSSYTTVASWNQGDEFNNNVREYDSVTIIASFSSTTKLRFRCDASGNSDWIYLDEVEITGCNTSSSSSMIQDNPNKNSGPDRINLGKLGMVKYYPNPVGTELTIELEAEAEQNQSYRIFDLQGKIVQEGALEPGLKRHQIKLDEIASGLIFIQVGEGLNWTEAYRLMKQ